MAVSASNLEWLSKIAIAECCSGKIRKCEIWPLVPPEWEAKLTPVALCLVSPQPSPIELVMASGDTGMSMVEVCIKRVLSSDSHRLPDLLMPFSRCACPNLIRSAAVIVAVEPAGANPKHKYFPEHVCNLFGVILLVRWPNAVR